MSSSSFYGKNPVPTETKTATDIVIEAEATLAEAQETLAAVHSFLQLTNDNPANLGVPFKGASDEAARADHIHQMPSKGDVGLGNVDNTSDVNKPVSTAQQTALDAKANTSGASFTGPVSFANTVTASVIHAGSSNTISFTGNTFTFDHRPSWATYTPWDSGNLNPANYVAKAGDTMTGSLSFGSVTRQMVNLYANSVGMGVQASNTLYQRTGGAFAIYAGGVHSDDAFDPGTGGSTLLRAGTDGTFQYQGHNVWHAGNFDPSASLQANSNNTWTGTNKFSAEIQSTAANNYRMIYGNYGTFWRQDSATLYLMFTNSGDQYGSWNSLRPIRFDIATGKAYFDSGIGGSPVFDNDVSANTVHVRANGSQGLFLGDDVSLGDCNDANTFRIVGSQNANAAGIQFGNTSAKLYFDGTHFSLAGGDLSLDTADQRLYFKSGTANTWWAVMNTLNSYYIQRFDNAGNWKQNSFHIEPDDQAYFVNTLHVGSSFIGTDGNIYMPWAGDYLSNQLNSKLYSAGQSFNGNGYMKFSNGLILQWGAGAGDQTVAFPVAFPSYCSCVTGNVQLGGSTNNLYAVYFETPSTTGVTGRCRYVPSGGTSGPVGNIWLWFAIGW